jgi:hypothetical protein
VVLDWLFFAAIPVLLLVGLVLSLRWRGRSPLWLPLAACAALGGIGVWSVFSITPYIAFPGDGASYYLFTFAWGLLAGVLLVLAALAVWRKWSARTALLIAGFAVPAPLMAIMLTVAASGASVWS